MHVIHRCVTFDLIREINPFLGSSVETSRPPTCMMCRVSFPLVSNEEVSAPDAAWRGPGWHGRADGRVR